MRTPCPYSRARASAPCAARFAYLHGMALAGLGRLADAVAAFQDAIQREPTVSAPHLALSDPAIHRAYNSLLYRLGRTEKYLSSYDRAPKSRELMLARAQTLSLEKRGAEAHDIYAELPAREGKRRRQR